MHFVAIFLTYACVVGLGMLTALGALCRCRGVTETVEQHLWEWERKARRDRMGQGRVHGGSALEWESAKYTSRGDRSAREKDGRETISSFPPFSAF